MNELNSLRYLEAYFGARLLEKERFLATLEINIAIHSTTYNKAGACKWIEPAKGSWSRQSCAAFLAHSRALADKQIQLLDMNYYQSMLGDYRRQIKEAEYEAAVMAGPWC